MRVIVAIDGSAHSQSVLEWVKQTPWSKGTRFLLLSAVPIPISTFAVIEAGASNFVEDMQESQQAERQEMVAVAERDLQSRALAVESRVEHGDARDLIVRAAETEHADMVVLGSRGHGGLARLLIGSVAGYVASHAPCTVVIVKDRKSAVARS